MVEQASNYPTVSRFIFGALPAPYKPAWHSRRVGLHLIQDRVVFEFSKIGTIAARIPKSCFCPNLGPCYMWDLTLCSYPDEAAARFS